MPWLASGVAARTAHRPAPLGAARGLTACRPVPLGATRGLTASQSVLPGTDGAAVEEIDVVKDEEKTVSAEENGTAMARPRGTTQALPLGWLAAPAAPRTLRLLRVGPPAGRM